MKCNAHTYLPVSDTVVKHKVLLATLVRQIFAWFYFRE